MSRLYRAGPGLLAGLLFAAAQGCGGGNQQMDMGGGGDAAGGDMAGGGSLSATPASTSGDYTAPLDTVPSPDGKTFYFTANHVLATGDLEPAVFQVAASGGAATAIASGAPLAGPFGITVSSDGKTLYLADASSANANEDDGAVFSLPSGGGTPSPISGTAGLKPRGIDLVSVNGADTLYFSGTDATDASGAVYTIAPSGGAAAQLVKGLGDPGGLAVTASGDVYLADTNGADDKLGQIVKLSGGSAVPFVGGLVVGYPAGVALTRGESRLLVSGIDPETNTSVVYTVDLATKAVGKNGSGISMNTDSGGLHRARTADVFSWAGVTAGAGGGGVVYRVTIN